MVVVPLLRKERHIPDSRDRLKRPDRGFRLARGAGLFPLRRPGKSIWS
jgi:hypothetical protein